ncbi:MAG: transcription antitermination factor NusB [Persicimonas sp.]
MSVDQQRAREIALWVLYGMDAVDQLVPEAIEGFYHIAHDLEPDVPDVWQEVEERVRGVIDQRPALDDEIQQVSPRWRVERMAVIDRNILRLGVWEILSEKTPPLVVINACVELAKDYGEQNTPGFVNGLLDQICKDRGIEIAAKK